MKRINRPGRLQRLRSPYIGAKSNVGQTNRIEKVNKINHLKNTSDKPSDNFLLAYDRYYEAISTLKKQFSSFYRHQKRIQHALQHKNREKDTLIFETKKLIHCYNEAIKALKKYDQITNQTKAESIFEVYRSFKRPLRQLGIQARADGTLTFSVPTFSRYLNKPTKQITDQLTQFQAMIVKKYFTFLRATRYKQKNKYNQQLPPVKGLVIEEKR